MRAPPTTMINSVDTFWMRRPQIRRGTATAGPRDDPRKASMNISNPMVIAKIRNASIPVTNPPTPVAKAATAAKKGAVQPTPTTTNPAPNTKLFFGVGLPMLCSQIRLPIPMTFPMKGKRLVCPPI